MAANVNADSLRQVLRRPERTAANPFAVLKDIGAFVTLQGDRPESVEIVLRALEIRTAFGPFGEILDALARRVGLFPYVDTSTLHARDLLAYEYHRPLHMDQDLVFHRVQAEVYRYLLAGENVILSAPTSFGKSKIIDAMVSLGEHQNIAIVVPTIALIDETRRRLARFGEKYKIVTHVSQQPADSNLFVFTAERAVAFEELPPIDFFVIDEFYKLGMHNDRDRMVALNEAFYRLRKSGGQFYLLGPNIDRIPSGAEGVLNARWIRTDYATVVSEQFRVDGDDPELDRLISLCKTLDEPTIIYCASPASVNTVARALLSAGVGPKSSGLEPMAEWAGSVFHREWVFVQAILSGIGIHHGRLPRSLGQMVVQAFNREELRFLVCTSTLIEGVNTKAKNVVIYDNKVAKKRLDFFTFNNIKGRSGRMFEHFIGHVYLFSDPPAEDLPFVDLPVLTQDAKTPSSLLMQIEADDLKPEAAARMRELLAEGALPLSVLRKNSAVDPEAQLSLAKELQAIPESEARVFAWRQFPQYFQLKRCCEAIWTHLVPTERRAGVVSASQLAFKVSQLQFEQDVGRRILRELEGPYAAKTVDEAVERVLNFDRTWASFEFPRYLMALSRIQAHVFEARGLPTGDYSLFASKVESLFRAPVLAALDEYGIPPAIGEKLIGALGTEEDLDTALNALKRLDAARLRVGDFERQVIQDATESI